MAGDPSIDEGVKGAGLRTLRRATLEEGEALAETDEDITISISPQSRKERRDN